MRTKNALNPWYVTGFAEGAGSFTFSRTGDQVTLVFAVRTGPANRELLEELRDYLAGGKIYATGKGGRAYFRVNRTRELLRLVEHFDTYPLRGSKAAAFRIWREMVLLRAAHHGSRAPEELKRLAESLRQATRRSSPGPPATEPSPAERARKHGENRRN